MAVTAACEKIDMLVHIQPLFLAVFAMESGCFLCGRKLRLPFVMIFIQIILKYVDISKKMYYHPKWLIVHLFCGVHTFQPQAENPASEMRCSMEEIIWIKLAEK